MTKITEVNMHELLAKGGDDAIEAIKEASSRFLKLKATTCTDMETNPSNCTSEILKALLKFFGDVCEDENKSACKPDII